ncbi:PREDICTED: uncharacterized protein LOC105111265 [Populus euphratica]|uniref:Uncharacterized protein LOC105111265 n=1 Tax=Populus euphratica TaxID=75702 RepID=A0AAJ6X400_POPEU|nr:PREDICTED: uncharacterized protein LOC105111265 [Populus euphratica]
MEIVRKEEDGDDDEEEELKTILFYQFEYIPNQTPKILELKKMESKWTWIKHSTRMMLGMARWKWSGIFNPMETLFLCKKLTRHRSFSSIHSSIWLVCCPYCSSNLVGIFLHVLELLF